MGDCSRSCRHCWSSISILHVLTGLFLLVATIFLFITHLHQWYPGVWWLLGFVTPLGCLIVRAYLSTTRLSAYFYPKCTVRWRRLILCALFACVPILDFLYISQGAPKVVVRPFFINEWPNLMDELAEEISYSGNYNVSIQGKNSFIVDASSGRYDIEICGDKIRIAHDENTVELQCCVLDGPYELAARIVTQIEG